MASFTPDWSRTVCERLDALFERADAGFSRSLPERLEPGVVGDMLWEADAETFAERYPDSGIVESYGSGWPAPCIDYWVYVDLETRRATLSTEGWSADDPEIELSGDGTTDADRLADALAKILRMDHSTAG